MTWNGIDMQLVLKEDVNPIEALGRIFTFLTKDPDFI